MKALTAKREVLYQGRMYKHGDTLPAGDSRMVEAWLEAESAEWTGEAQEPDPEAQGEPKPAEGAQEGQEPDQEAQGEPKPAEGAQEGQEGQGGKDAAAERENAAGAPETPTGHLDPEQLAGMKKEALEKLAAQLNVDISKAKNNRERAAMIRPPLLTAGGAR